jgi:hypothetical protein
VYVGRRLLCHAGLCIVKLGEDESLDYARSFSHSRIVKEYSQGDLNAKLKRGGDFVWLNAVTMDFNLFVNSVQDLTASDRI